MRVDPVYTEGDDGVDAMKQLRSLAEEQHRRSPEMSPEKAFATAYANNPHLAAKERRQAMRRLGV
jgi:hypothetical protein